MAQGAQARLTVVSSASQPRWESAWCLAFLASADAGLGNLLHAQRQPADCFQQQRNDESRAGSLQRNSRRASLADFDELTIIRFDRRKESFDDIVNVLDADAIKQQQASNPDIKGSQEFFSGNISSLLNVASDVSRIEIKRKSQGYRPAGRAGM